MEVPYILTHYDHYNFLITLLKIILFLNMEELYTLLVIFHQNAFIISLKIFDKIIQHLNQEEPYFETNSNHNYLKIILKITEHLMVRTLQTKE